MLQPKKINKWIHNFFYWTNPFYMISYDISKSPKIIEFINNNFGHILKPIIEKIDKFLNRF